jgi:hypothetical protein
VDANVTKRLPVSKCAMRKFDIETFNLKELNDMEVTEQYKVKISNRFAALENLGDNVYINRGTKSIRIKNFSHREFRLLNVGRT